MASSSVIHIESWQDIRDSVQAGADAVTHLPSDPPPADLVEHLAEAGTVVIATMAHSDPLFLEQPTVLDAPLVRGVTTAAVLDAYRSFAPTEVGQRTQKGLRAAQDVRLQTLRQLSEAGVPLATGTDPGNWFALQGYSVHHELALMVEAGLDPWQALAAGTTNAGKFLGLSVGFTKGDLGSVVILEASPLEDIHNTERIAEVVHHGVVLDRAALRAKASDVWRPTQQPSLAP